MLPPEKYERALQLFCRILHRLEERDKIDEEIYNTNSGGAEGTGVHLSLETRVANGSSLPGVPASLYAGTEGKR
jgi:hypothetical protein